MQPLGVFSELETANKRAKSYSIEHDITVFVYGYSDKYDDIAGHYYQVCFIAPHLRNSIAKGLKILKKYFPVNSHEREDFFPGLLNGAYLHIPDSVPNLSAKDYVALCRLDWVKEDNFIRIPRVNHKLFKHFD
jgi:hypothetical protein